MASKASARVRFMKPHVELVSTGSELLSGRTVNRHAAVLGAALAQIGIDLRRDTTVPDDEAAIQEAVTSALARADVVFVSGGLGPTEDDVTRDAMARWLGRRVVTNPGALANLQERLRALGRTTSPSLERQALIVEGAIVLPNPVGLAPGEFLEVAGKGLFLLPGPPEEFRAVLEQHVIPWLKQRFSGLSRVFSHVFLICGLGESAIMERFRAADFPPTGVRLAYCAAPGRVELRLSSEDPDVLRQAVKKARSLLGTSVFSEDSSPLEAVVGRLLKERKATLAVAESCTGGLLGGRITQQPGSSDYFLGGIVCYSNRVKTELLDVPADILRKEGAVSEQTASIMAANVRAKLASTYGVAITGIAGPSGGTPEKPVGTVFIAVADEWGTICRLFRFTGHRDRIREWSVQMALDTLRRRILGLGHDE